MRFWQEIYWFWSNWWAISVPTYSIPCHQWRFCIQGQMDIKIAEEHLMDTFHYLDVITVAGSSQEGQYSNVAAFLKVVSKRNLTLNESKSVLSSYTINVLGYLIGNGVVRPDPEWLRLLQELPPPTNVRSQRRVIRLFANYTKRIQTFQERFNHCLRQQPSLSQIAFLRRSNVDSTLYTTMAHGWHTTLDTCSFDRCRNVVIQRWQTLLQRCKQCFPQHYPMLETQRRHSLSNG